jgi:hypothetical protein
MTLQEVGKSYFPIMYAYQKQLVYMQHYLKLGSHTVCNFATRLRELNNYLPYFPREKGKPKPSKLSDDDLVFILNQAKPEEWQAVILGANIKLYQFDFHGTNDYFEKLEFMQDLKVKRRSKESTDNTGSNRNQSNRNKDIFERPNHSRSLRSVRIVVVITMQQKGKTKPGKKPTDKTVMMTTEQLNTILAKLLPKNPKSGTRKVHYFSPVQSDTEDVQMFGPKTKLSKVDINH